MQIYDHIDAKFTLVSAALRAADECDLLAFVFLAPSMALGISGFIMLEAILPIAVLGLVFGLGLGWAARKFRADADPVVEQIEAILPQTQCAQCGYPGCRPYAEAIASGEADINQCPPGGDAGIRALADLLGREPKPLNPENGVEQPKRVAVIDEEICIGCTLCIQACPVDAIVGAPKLMHTVIESECTGCDLCLPPCPVDCIAMVARPESVREWRWPRPTRAQARRGGTNAPGRA